MMIKKFISQSGVTIESGDFYGGGTDEVVSSLEENGSYLNIITNLDIYRVSLSPGDYLGMADGSGKTIKNKHDE